MADRKKRERINPEPDDFASAQPMWSFRGYHLKGSEFTTAMVHMFRAEIQRANVWRQRLDTTTNWAVIATGAAISFAFSETLPGSHSVIILNTLLVTLFLLIEARRYRYYEVWSYRVRLMETDFFAAMLVPPFQPSPDWAESLAEHLLHPNFPISIWEAFGRRFRRNYLIIFVILGLAWMLKIGLHPTATTSWAEFIDRASVGGISGWVVLTIGLVYNGALMLVGLATMHLMRASGEVLPRYLVAESGLKSGGDKRGAWFRPSARRQQVLALIITGRAKVVSDKILSDMGRGVTKLEGVGMYTGKNRAVLMCAMTITEVAHLKSVVQASDPDGFVVVAPAQEVLGKGFLPLEE